MELLAAKGQAIIEQLFEKPSILLTKKEDAQQLEYYWRIVSVKDPDKFFKEGDAVAISRSFLLHAQPVMCPISGNLYLLIPVGGLLAKFSDSAKLQLAKNCPLTNKEITNQINSPGIIMPNAKLAEA